jgi:hypothetical protein
VEEGKLPWPAPAGREGAFMPPGLRMIRPIAGCVLVLAAGVGAARGQPAPKPWGGEREVALRAAERDAARIATITSATVAAPLGYILLARGGADLSALRFTEFHRAHAVGVGALFSSGDETLYGEYDWYHQGDGSGDLTKGWIRPLSRMRSKHR